MSKLVQGMLKSLRNEQGIVSWGKPGGETVIIGVFGDVHGNLPALEAVLEDGKGVGVEQWFCLGDMAFKGPAPEECLRVIHGLCSDTTIMGNTEEWLPVGPPKDEGKTPEIREAIERWWQWTISRIDQQDLAWASQLPHTRTLAFGQHRLLCVHATTRGLEDAQPPTASASELQLAFNTPQYTLVACAHIHTPYLRRADGCTVFNTGSTGRPIDGDPRSSYVILDLSQEAVSVNFRRVPYDLDRAAILATERAFPSANDYEKALRHGSNF